jgi:hypothetical protein
VRSPADERAPAQQTPIHVRTEIKSAEFFAFEPDDQIRLANLTGNIENRSGDS